MVVERRKNKKRKDGGFDGSLITDKPSKEEYAVAKWIRNNVPSKKTKFDRNHIVEYFTGTRAVDALLEKSPWSKTIFESRQHVVDFLETMLRHKFFHRAKKIVITEDELIRIKGIKKKGKESKDSKEEKKPVEKEIKKEKEKEKEKDKDENDSKEVDDTKKEEKEKDKDENESKEVYDTKKEEKKESKKQEKRKDLKKKPKVRLEMHMDQYFVDCNDAYVWIYEPIPIYYWFFGTLLVLGGIGLCLFPLWPLTVRHGVWYLSVGAAGFLVFILSLIVIRLIVFCVLWVLTLGRHHLWLLPNLIEDVGFFASFWPLYHYEYYGPSSDKKSLKKKKRKKDKDSDAEDDGHSHSEEKSESSSEASKPDSPSARKSSKEDKCQISDGHEASEEGSESDKSNTGGDFEML